MTIKAPYFDILLAPTVIELARKEKPFTRVYVAYKLNSWPRYFFAFLAVAFWHYPKAIATKIV